MTKRIVEVAIAEIVERKELMPRKGVADAVVMDYKSALELLPPILLGMDEPKSDEEGLVVQDNGKVYVLLDGWHRLAAHSEEGLKTIRAVVDMTIKPEDFRAEAAKANKAHGRRLTADEKRAVARKLYLEENRDADFIADVIGCSDRHARRLVESFESAKKELYMKKAYALAQKKNPDTGKPFTIREIADQLDSPEYSVSKSAVGRWIKKVEKDKAADLAPETDEVEEIDYDEEVEDEDEEPEIVLPAKDVQSADEFISKMSDLAAQVGGIDKKAKALTYSKDTITRMETAATVLRKALSDLEDTLMDLSLA